MTILSPKGKPEKSAINVKRHGHKWQREESSAEFLSLCVKRKWFSQNTIGDFQIILIIVSDKKRGLKCNLYKYNFTFLFLADQISR